MNIILRDARILLEHTHCNNQFSYQLRGCVGKHLDNEDEPGPRFFSVLVIVMLAVGMFCITSAELLFGFTLSNDTDLRELVVVASSVQLLALAVFVYWHRRIHTREHTDMLPPEMAECISTIGLGPFGKLVFMDDYDVKKRIFVYLASKAWAINRQKDDTNKSAKWDELSELMKMLEKMQGYWIAPLWEKDKWNEEYHGLIREFTVDTKKNVIAWAEKKAENANNLWPALI